MSQFNMEKLTGEQIIQKLKDADFDIYAFAYDNWLELNPEGYEPSAEDLGYSEEQQERLNYLGLGEVKEVESYGGEGQGETWYSVKYFKDHDVFIRVNGFYYSYDGVNFYNGWDDVSVVQPKQKTITVYE